MSRVAMACCSCMLLLSACASAPTHFYTLLPPAHVQSAGVESTAARSTSAPDSQAPFAIDVEPVGVPTQVDQAAWLVRTGTGQVALLDNERWAAPLDDELQSAFSDALTRRLDVRDVHGMAKLFSGPVYLIRVDVRRFESVPDHYALIRADWSVSKKGAAKPSPRLTCSSNVSQPVGHGYAALAVGHQQAVAAIAAAIAQAVDSLADGKGACPPA